MNLNIAVISGDGIGPEIVKEARAVLDKVAKKFNHNINYKELLAGGIAIDMKGSPLPKETVTEAKNADAVLLGAVGGYKWENLKDMRPEQALLGLREQLGLFANFRPAVLFKELKNASPLKDEIIKDGLDILIVRELTGGIYFGKSGRAGDTAFDTESYSKYEIARILVKGREAALKRNKRLHIVDKANVLESSRLWREVAKEVFEDNSGIDLNYMYIDNAAMQLIRNPGQFDVIVTSNIFGDILSDEASMLTGSIGMLPSASLGCGNIGMYEPIHGSAPDIAGMNIANPIATILSVSMMFLYSFGLEEESKIIESAVQKTLEKGFRTKDIAENGKYIKTSEMGEKIREEIGEIQ